MQVLADSMLRLLLLATLARLSTAAFDPELHAKYLQLPRDEFIRYFNSQNHSWKMTTYPPTHPRHHSCLSPKHYNQSNLETRRHDPEIFAALPESFDARQNWPDCSTIGTIYNQGDCGSCWAFSTATMASDRTCIAKGLHVTLSPQDLDCLQAVCEAGNIDKSFPFWQQSGLVTRDCKPYNISDTRECVKECQDTSINYDADKHFAENVYRVSPDENDIKAELIKNGPISAAMIVYDDFRDTYESGVYEHKFGNRRSGHAVKLIGYGTDNGKDYWLVANSWGPTWGENGFFRIKRQQEEIEFETFLHTGTVKS